MARANIMPYEIAKLWMDVSTLEMRVVDLELLNPPAPVMRQILLRVSGLDHSLYVPQRHKADSASYRRVIQLVKKQASMVSLMTKAWSSES